MSEYENWDIGGEQEKQYGSVVADFVDQQVGLAFGDFIAGAELWLSVDGTPRFEIADAQYKYCKTLCVDDVKLGLDAEQKSIAIEFLRGLILRIEASDA